MQRNTQQLERSIKPWSAVSAPCSLVEGLKDSERVGSVSFDVKTLSNIPEEHLTREQGRHSILVPVLNKHNQPLMPCKASRAKKLLREGKAKIVNRVPFVIKLLFGSSRYKQDITLGIDSGYSTIGFSAVANGRELIAGELTLRNDIKRLLEKRRAYRRTRRARLWHREPRFNNRSKPKGWLAPSLQHKLDTHLRLIDRLKKILPITEIVVEVASFDTQKMQNPEISGVEYQQGELCGYEIREYLLEKWGRKCAYCGKKDIPIEIEHIIPKSRGGSNRVDNLTIACHKCNQEKGNQTAEEFGHQQIQNKAKLSLKATAFMNNIRWMLVNQLNCDRTYGYITKHNRTKLGIGKSPANDAFVIACLRASPTHRQAGGTDQKRSGHVIVAKQVRRQNRSLYKANLLKGGRLKRNTVKEVNGFRRFDKVLYDKVECFIHGLRTSGYFDLRSITGDKIGSSVNSKKLMLLEHAKGMIKEVQAIPPHPEGRGFLA